ncbi:cupin domain-containing protein [Acidisoma cellulosilytica]|uniref:Cupin domain-containing protein n=1 Tax=Acidisoma cellulosilyticum TaxID=2802395 RepID=A0A963Z049_9PROT|nr:cupin domain-containing protein [Acidisoma cellulosilyticum]MCB8880266.1 cupin domain-containing protein [Acidisoma cellulosilyticum]
MVEIIHIGAMELRFLHSKHDTGGMLDMFEMVLHPNAAMPVAHSHRDWEETIYGLSGVSRWTLDGTTLDLPAGESLFIPRGIVHGFDNKSGDVARCLVILTPGALGPDYFREVAAAIPAEGPPDVARMREIMGRYGLIPAPPRPRPDQPSENPGNG